MIVLAFGASPMALFCLGITYYAEHKIVCILSKQIQEYGLTRM